MWPLPIPEEMYDRLRRDTVADVIQHDWIRYGGGLFAAAFLENFVDGLPWAHLDIAGPAFHSGGPSGHIVAGGTGFSVPTLVALAETASAWGRVEGTDTSSGSTGAEGANGRPRGRLRQLSPRSFIRRL
jgi:hypothetical protein